MYFTLSDKTGICFDDFTLADVKNSATMYHQSQVEDNEYGSGIHEFDYFVKEYDNDDNLVKEFWWCCVVEKDSGYATASGRSNNDMRSWHNGRV